MSRRGFCVVVAILAIPPSLACGPSFQAIYEGNARFEHCYALEERAQIPLSEKSECWHDWSVRYTFGQTRDRIHYATARYVALSQSVPTDEAMMMAAPGMSQRLSTITAPDPTNAFAPPPKVLEPAGAASSKGQGPSDLPTVVATGSAPLPSTGSAPLPSAECAGTCGTTFYACKGAACEKSYRACMRSCMK